MGDSPTIWVSASSTRFWMLNDPLLDWYTLSKRKCLDLPTKTKQSNTQPNCFASFLLSRGNEFESEIVEELKHKFSDCIENINNFKDYSFLERHEITKQKMKQGFPIILNACLLSRSKNVYGIPDLLIRNDWISKVLGIEFETISPYFYIVVDIKFSTLKFRKGNRCIRSSPSANAFKAQTYVYLLCCNEMQKVSKFETFLWGRNGIGKVDFSKPFDSWIPAEIDKCIEWKKICLQNQFDLNSKCLPHSNLYPNMCNASDYPWTREKKQLARFIQELTCIWNVSPKHRTIAHSNGVFEYTDPRCNSTTLGITGNRRKKIVDSICEIQRNGLIVSPSCIQTNFQNWQTKKRLELYIDFEGISNIFNIPEQIFCIGVGVLENELFQYYSFTSDLKKGSEEKMLKQFCDFLKNLKSLDTSLFAFCWGHAEKTYWKKVCSIYNFCSDIPLLWFDMCRVFLAEPIVIQGCTSFSLKQIAKSLKFHGKINTSWNGTIENGMTAMINIVNAKRNGNLIEKLGECEEYNRVDVTVLYEIVQYLRKCHCESNQTHEKKLPEKVIQENYFQTKKKRKFSDI